MEISGLGDWSVLLFVVKITKYLHDTMTHFGAENVETRSSK